MEKYLSSSGSFLAVVSVFILLLPAGGHLLDKVLGTLGVLFGLLAFGVFYHIIQSMTANSIRAGWGAWVPEGILNKITDLVQSELEAKLTRSQLRRDVVK